MANQYPTWQSQFHGGTAFPWLPGAGGIDPEWATGAGQQYLGAPEDLWTQGRLAQMSQGQLANPRWTRQAATGFTPLWGEYMLGGDVGGGGFSGFLGQRTSPAITGTQFGTPPMADQWAQAIAASQGLMQPEVEVEGDLNPSIIALQNWMVGENARRNSIAMVQAQMGGGVGASAMARQRALGSMYDLYGARQAATGDPQGGFIDWIARRLNKAGG